MRRRQFLSALGGAAAWPFAVRAQPSIPVIGFLSGLAAADRPDLPEAFRKGLNETGYGEGRNVSIEYRYAANQSDRLGELAAGLVARKVAVIAAVGGNNTALVAKRFTSTIPILFTSGVDPVKAGLVASINRPEANVTGVSWFTGDLGSKHLQMLNELVPQAKVVALLMDPSNPEGEIYAQSTRDSAGAFGQRLLVLNAGTPDEIDGAFATLAENRAGGVIVSAGPFYAARFRQLAGLAARYAVPLLAAWREIPAAGGLLSYGNSVPDAYRRVGVYAGRILNGARPADMPIDRATRFELVINLRTAKALGIEVPRTLLARADEVIE
jgi:putative ABC transport system substrate-binding protein